MNNELFKIGNIMGTSLTLLILFIYNYELFQFIWKINKVNEVSYKFINNSLQNYIINL